MVGYASLLQPKICISKCSIYNHWCWYSRITENFRPDSPSKSSPTRNSAKTTLCWTSFDQGTQTCRCSLVSYIEGLDLEELAPNLFQRWFTFSSPKMWWMNPRMHASKWACRNCLRTGSWQNLWWKRHNVGSITYNHRKNLVRIQGNVTTQRYRDDMLQSYMLNVIARQSEMFQQDNTRSHTLRVTMYLRTQSNINVLSWPSKSSDLNPMEHLWDELDKRFCQRQPHLNHWINPVKRCNMNGKGYHRSEYKMWVDPCQRDAEQC